MVQTFLPYLGKTETAYEFYEECAGLLSVADLKKQRVCTYQILKALLVGGTSWDFHPVTMMWASYEWSLLTYQHAICETLVHDCGVQDSFLDKTIKLYFQHADLTELADYGPPDWLGDRKMSISHQSGLLRGDYDYYSKKFKGVPKDLPYVWPV